MSFFSCFLIGGAAKKHRWLILNHTSIINGGLEGLGQLVDRFGAYYRQELLRLEVYVSLHFHMQPFSRTGGLFLKP